MDVPKTTTVEFDIFFPGGKHVFADIDARTLWTQNGSDLRPGSPVQTFLASVGSCAAIYLLGFCQARNLPADSLRLHEVAHVDPSTASIQSIELQVVVPPDFPERYREALGRVAEGNVVKRALQVALSVQVTTQVREAAA